MNLKGLKITKYLSKQLFELGSDNVSNDLLKGLEEFKKYSWNSFNKQEFFGLINSLNYLFEKEIFLNLNDEQLFIFNYTTDVTEMDIVTALKKDKKNIIIIDIEYKISNNNKEKIDAQLNERVSEHMIQLFPNQDYILIGMDDDGFYKAIHCRKNKIKVINKIQSLKRILDKYNSANNIETIFTQANDLSMINKLYNQIKDNTFKYYADTKVIYNDIMQKVESGNKVIICFAKPGVGKTILALKLFFENKDSKFLMMNQKFYYALNLEKYFEEKKCFYGSDTFVCQDLSQSITIIDEAQRLTKERLLLISKRSKCTILFGDLNQSFMESDLEITKKELKKYFEDNGLETYIKEINKSKRYNDTVEKALSFLTSRLDNVNDIEKIQDYSINICNSEKEFVDAYKNCSGEKKIFTTYRNKDNKVLTINNEEFYIAPKNEYGYSITNGNENYIGHTLHAISFDVENCFVYLNNVCLIKGKNKRQSYIIYKDKFDNFDNRDVNKTVNELNILFTRGKKSLTIFTNDLKLYLYLKSKIKKIL